ncbi:MAG TPA: zinc-binding dehydrogenase, partial [Actinomycetota bacterium]|nr:zinc-binding dehydrogenase [Actinomycetota bacterium]
AKLFGAETTGVCSARNLGLVRPLDADHVIDHTREDLAGNGRRYDLIFQLAGTRSPAAIRRALTPKGRLILSSGESPGRWVGPMDRIVKAAALPPFVPQTLVPFEARQSRDDLQVLKDLIEAGRLTPVIDRTYPLRETPDALRHLDKGHARGKVVITV